MPVITPSDMKTSTNKPMTINPDRNGRVWRHFARLSHGAAEIKDFVQGAERKKQQNQNYADRRSETDAQHCHRALPRSC